MQPAELSQYVFKVCVCVHVGWLPVILVGTTYFTQNGPTLSEHTNIIFGIVCAPYIFAGRAAVLVARHYHHQPDAGAAGHRKGHAWPVHVPRHKSAGHGGQ